MRRQFTAILLVLAMLVAMVAMFSCGNPTLTEFEMPDEGYDGSEVTIKFYHTMGANLSEVLEDYIVEFNKLYPNIKIEHTQVGGYDDVRKTISTELMALNHPNLAYCYPDHVALYNMAGAVVTLDQFINNTAVVERADGTTEIMGLTDAQKADFIEGYYNEGMQFGDGLMYTLPLSKSTEVLYYNKTYFDVAQKMYTSDVALDLNGNPIKDKDGNTTPNPNKGNEMYNLFVPTTWDELEIICARIIGIENDRLADSVKSSAAKIETDEFGYKIYIDKDGKKLAEVIPLGYDSEANWFITMCEQLGTDYTSATAPHFTFDNEANQAFVKEFREWYDAGYVTTQEILGSYTSSLFTTTDGIRSYMSIGSSAGATHQRPSADTDGNYPFEVGIAPIPQVNPENPKAISQGPSLCILKKDNPQEVIASWLFAKFLTTNVDFQAEFSMASGYVPVIKSVGEHPVYKNFLNKADGGAQIAALSAKVCMEQVDSYYTSPAFNGSSVARDQVGLLMKDCLTTPASDITDMIKKRFAAAIKECEYQIS